MDIDEEEVRLVLENFIDFIELQESMAKTLRIACDGTEITIINFLEEVALKLEGVHHRQITRSIKGPEYKRASHFVD